MKLWSFSAFASCCVIILIVSMTHAKKGETSPAGPVLIRTGRLLDVRSGAYKADQGVMIEGGYIKEVGAFTTIREKRSRALKIVDLSRATLLPGLIDCHSHLFSAMDGKDDTTARMTEAERMKVGVKQAREYLDSGVTTVRDLGFGGGLDTLLRNRIRAGLILGPDIFAASRRLTPAGEGGMTDASRPEVIRNIAEVSGGRENALRITREVMQTGADVIKAVVNVGPRLLLVEEISAIVEEAHRAGLKVAAHATSAAAIKIAVTVNAAELLGVSAKVGVIETGKIADIIAVDGDPLTDITVLERVKFVMKKGLIVKNEISK